MGRVGLAAAAGFAAGHVAMDQGARAGEAGVGELGGEFPEPLGTGLELGR